MVGVANPATLGMQVLFPYKSTPSFTTSHSFIPPKSHFPLSNPGTKYGKSTQGNPGIMMIHLDECGDWQNSSETLGILYSECFLCNVLSPPKTLHNQWALVHHCPRKLSGFCLRNPTDHSSVCECVCACACAPTRARAWSWCMYPCMPVCLDLCMFTGRGC